MLLNRTYKIAAVYESICSRPHILPPFFMHNFPRQLGRNTSLFFYFYASSSLFTDSHPGLEQRSTNEEEEEEEKKERKKPQNGRSQDDGAKCLSEPINNGCVNPAAVEDNPRSDVTNGLANLHPFIVTHVHPRKTNADANGGEKCWSKKCLDSWHLSFKQTVKWSELANLKNLEIDGVSKLRVRQDKIDFEYNLYEEKPPNEEREEEEKEP